MVNEIPEKDNLWFIVPGFIMIVGGFFLWRYLAREKPPEPAPEEYPREISRGPHKFLAYNMYEEKELKEFLGIEPEGVDLDTYLSKLDSTGLEQWRDYWINVWGGLNRDDLTVFTVAKFEEYYIKVPPIPPEPKYPKEISRTGVTILAYNVEEEKQIKEFLGIDPPGVDIDTFILAMNLASLIQWRNYWNGVWAYLKRNDLIQLTNAFYEAAHAQLPPTPPVPPPEEGRAELINWSLLT